MSEKFDILDEWGNKIGELVPAGGGNGLVTCLVYLTLLLGGFIIAIPIFLLIKGVKYWEQNEKEKATLCWLALFVIVLTPFLIQAQLNAEKEARVQAREARSIALQNEITEATQAIPQTVEIGNVRIEQPSTYELILYFTVINYNRMTIYGGGPVVFYFTDGEKVVTSYFEFRGGGFIEPGNSSEEGRQRYYYWEGKEERELKSFCVPVEVVRIVRPHWPYESGETRYVCRELDVVYKVVPYHRQ